MSKELEEKRHTKAEGMDKLIDSYEKGISSSDIFTIVNQIFKFDLEAIPALSNATEGTLEVLSLTPRVALHTYLEQCADKVTGAEIRKMINQTFGINLDALSALEGARISLYSKSQWMLQHDEDLFVVHTGIGDVDVKIFQTTYFSEQTGLEELPNDLIQALIPLGYYYDAEIGSYYFSNPTGDAVPDAFKGQTIMAIIKVITHSYSHL
ncbi:hypothetical protein Back11_47750 [Paenibacillus baekrokdamisoli]|uniref:Uncharacterized protein n=1 Tax=Paenibacillus baekrokdamisoli TaxID=1712516 RepID=A0A3G9IX37_9BACL|nr:hypothetical protein [Paenibacillus baekrokdamisoli]MBB3068596.1 hypothetical protein [Paenibacillus baekrokdamisoli]BBH23430.1 hypothetical protein Back11_47750 [Paenibacillus baekrokdamisoli]